MLVSLALLALGVLTAVAAPRLLARADWAEREPVVALWVWQCVVAAVLLSFALSMTFSAAAAWQAVRGQVFAPAPRAVIDAYELGTHGPWSAALAVALAAGGLWTGAMLGREIGRARARRRRRRCELLVRAPLLPGEKPSGSSRLVVLEGERPDAWWLPGGAPRLVVTTAALRRLKGRQLDALLAHEQGHARARHDWLLHCSAALAGGFPGVPVFAAFRGEMHRLVELAADDVASRRFGRLTVALALVELNEDRGVFGPGPAPDAALPQRVNRLLGAAPRLTAARRLRLTAAAALVPVVPVLVAFVPALTALP
ncbi:M56 family metallopeptidase [Streptomyces roseicoloratus]|uniref:M56 family metallopeptidase n=1 Tax=Streptomyces roseicoloratus TaxID=2508722 RepID=A0ABY9S5H6_9ACTN|nr:M56 family metallopeptidase [Streptomyces roseicoloratus]WMX48240.1 M56 family metallopeptidase [Streptomyces roseicoloratus]